ARPQIPSRSCAFPRSKVAGAQNDVMSSGRAVAEALALLRDVVHQDVLAETLRRSVEDAALVHARDLVHELLQVVVAVQHEGVDDDVLLCAAPDLSQRLTDGDRAGRGGAV